MHILNIIYIYIKKYTVCSIYLDINYKIVKYYKYIYMYTENQSLTY